jgi:lon-related putative ATP-dependent protease
MTAVRSFVEKLAASKKAPNDFCYVHNFKDASQPRYLALPAGLGAGFQQDVVKLMEKVHSGIRKALESEEFNAKREELVKIFEDQRSEKIEELKTHINERDFTMQITPHGVLLIPVLKGEILSDEKIQKMPPDVFEAFEKKREALENDVKKAMKSIRIMEKETEDKIQELEKQQILYVLGGLFEDLIEKYQELPDVVNYLKDVEKDILENRALFKSVAEHSTPFGFLSDELSQRQYRVNVLISHKERSGAPVVVETNPTYSELFGRLERESHFGVLYSDFTLIKAGAIHRANGGYLVLQVEDVLRNPFSWDALKRAIRTGEIQIEDPAEKYGFSSGKIVRPQPIPLNLKVILTGSSLFYYLLSIYDVDFPELFKVQADFAESMPWNEKNMRGFLSFLVGFREREKIRNLDSEAIIAILEHTMRLAGDQEKLSAEFGVIADVLREADHWAQSESAPEIRQTHIQKAIDQNIYRSGLLQERLMEKTIRGTLLIDTEGAKEGQVNGLSFVALDHCSFGRPVRITASVAPGREGIIDIEREVKLGGPVHSKGVLILSGYLSQTYSAKHPLSLAARLVFEQSYSGVEGDSASAAELCALLSALAETPVDQRVAITGSVNQHGDVQAIGGVNEKIEGFFDLCNARGLKGKQGVIIPRSNVQNLMLRKNVVEAVRTGMFHVWAVERMDEAMEILTGIPAGTLDEKNEFPVGTLNRRIQQKLSEYAQTMKELTKPEYTKENVGRI